MEDDLIRVTPDKERAIALMTMVEKTLKMILTLDKQEFTSHIIKQYYEVLRELMSIILILDGFKTYGEGAHKKLIEYVGNKYLKN